ncbi:Gfo/Idh/MocA family protein [Chloroflexota bacterium]
MKILIAGCGSIGTRHLKNLQSLNAGELIVFDTDAERSRKAAETYGVRVVTGFTEALAEQPDAVLICTPTSLHIDYALSAARNGCHLFIEKPISHSLDRLGELISTSSQNVILIGCNFRFHGGMELVRQLIEDKKIGRVLFADAEFGQYLPDWHPWEDYRRGYSANKSLGGGIILDSIHELDYLYWLFGKADEVNCTAGKLSGLDIDVEDYAEIIIGFGSGTIARVHLDYLQRPYARTLKVVGESGTIEWDFADNLVRWYNGDEKAWNDYRPETADNINEMYIREMEHFLRCIEGKETPMANAQDGKLILEIALAARQSAETRQRIKLSDEGKTK